MLILYFVIFQESLMNRKFKRFEIQILYIEIEFTVTFDQFVTLLNNNKL